MQTGGSPTRVDHRPGAGVGARVLIDTTHATPFVEVADHIAGIDYLVCHAYKHLLGARGCAFLYVRADRLDDLEPTYANWRGAPDPWNTFFGGPLDLAERRRLGSTCRSPGCRGSRRSSRSGASRPGGGTERSNR